jgi:hypothetical protein
VASTGPAGWIRVPVGADAARWATRGRLARVLLVVHNVTSATRLLDVLPLFRDDLRVQLLVTCTGSSPFAGGVADLLGQLGLPVLPWEQALRTPVDLAISASFGGQLRDISGKLAVLSHGVGYNKTLGTPDTGHRTPDTGHRTPDTGQPVFGFSPEWLLADGKPFADALVLSHPEQLARLSNSCPEAVPSAVVAGDPCFDRMLAARPHRERFRRALGVGRGQRLVVLNSTWNPESLFGNGADDILPSLLARLTSELPADEFRVAAVLHPNIWHGHGPGQVRFWLDRARRCGLALVDPLEHWRQALIAADAVVGDFGSVSYYAAALGTPVLLGSGSRLPLDPRSPVGAFAAAAPRLDPSAPLRPQLDRLLAEHTPLPGPAELTTSVPGEAATRLRRMLYGLIGLREPESPALLDPLPLPPYEPPLRTAPLRVLTRVLGPAEVAVSRFPDPPYEPVWDEGTPSALLTTVHTAVHEDTLDPGLLAIADVILRYGAPDDPRLGSPREWAAEVLARHPECALAAYVTGPAGCTVRTRAGAAVEFSGSGADTVDPAAHASALHAWLATGKGLDELTAGGLIVRTGRTATTVSVTRVR